MNIPAELTTDDIRALVEELRQTYTAEREAGAAALEAAADCLEDLARCDGCNVLGYRGERGLDLTPDGRDYGLDGCAGCEGDFCPNCRGVRDDGDMWCHSCWTEKTGIEACTCEECVDHACPVHGKATCCKCGRAFDLDSLEDPLRGEDGHETGGPEGYRQPPWETVLTRLVCKGGCAPTCPGCGSTAWLPDDECPDCGWMAGPDAGLVELGAADEIGEDDVPF